MVLLSDTVGFVRRLPHQLVESFRSTLVEVGNADLLVHLVDAGAPEPEDRIEAVHSVLREIGASDVPEQIVFTKSDTVTPEAAELLVMTHPGSLTVSARTGDGVPEIPRVIGDRLRALEQVIELRVPYDRGDVLAGLHRDGEVLVEVHEEGGTRVRARLPQTVTGRYVDFIAPVPG
jgi:GTP-binding protein HflX